MMLQHKKEKKSNSILLPKLFWSTVRKKFQWSIQNNEIWCWKPRICNFFEITRKNHSNSERPEEIWWQNAFLTCPGGFSYVINWNNYNSNWEKLLGFRNMQEKLEKVIFLVSNKNHYLDSFFIKQTFYWQAYYFLR